MGSDAAGSDAATAPIGTTVNFWTPPKNQGASNKKKSCQRTQLEHTPKQYKNYGQLTAINMKAMSCQAQFRHNSGTTQGVTICNS